MAETEQKLKEELTLSQEREKAALLAAQSAQRQYDIINALSDDYLNIYAVYPETDTADIIKLKGFVVAGLHENMRGVPYTKTIDRYIYERVHPEDRQKFLDISSVEHVTAELKDKERFDFTYRTMIEGAPHYYTVRYRRVSKQDEAMRIIAGFRCVDDVVEAEKRSQRIQRESDAITAVNASVGSGYWHMTFNRRDEMTSCVWSQTFRKILGFKDENDFPDVCESWTDLIHPDYKEKVLELFWRAIKDHTNSTVYDTEYLCNTNDRGYRWFHDACRFVRREDGSPSALHGVFIDIDDTKKKEKAVLDALSAAEEANVAKALTAVHESMGSGYWHMTFDENAEMTSCTWTQKFRQMLGYNDENDFPNKLESWTDLVHPDDKKRTINLYWAAVKDKSGKAIYDLEYQLLTKDRGYRWFHAAGRVMRREDGSPISMHGVFIDIDDSRRKDKALKDALVAAENANKAKTTFLNNMSHDIRTPMNAIIGFTTLAATHLSNKEQVRDYLTKIQTSSNHLLALINDVLDMSRIESGKVTIDAKNASLPDILHDLRTIVQDDITSKRLEFFIDTIDVVDEMIVCDRLRLNQVLLNLISNAMKFTKPGGMVGVRVTELGEDSNASKRYATYKFEVRDSGIGIGKQFLPHLFEPFSREKSSTVSGIPGTGLGLSITKNIVDMMGGNISVTSERGKGTVFTVTLSFATSGEKEDMGPVKELMGLRALVVDDDFDTCASITKMLVGIGMRPDWTTSGKEAVLRSSLAIDQRDEYSAYIIDWLMPDMNGVEVVRRIRSNVNSGTPIIILTAYDWSDIEAEARAAGVTAFCSKPIFMSQLRAALTQSALPEERRGVKLLSKPEQLKEFENKRLLLVEDNALNREIAAEILQEVGFKVETAVDGEKALDNLLRHDGGYYDAILMDVQMPVMDGYEATKWMRSLEDKEKANIPIIAMTANAFEEDKQAAIDAGMTGYISKPIDINKMLDILRKALSK